MGSGHGRRLRGGGRATVLRCPVNILLTLCTQNLPNSNTIVFSLAFQHRHTHKKTTNKNKNKKQQPKPTHTRKVGFFFLLRAVECPGKEVWHYYDTGYLGLIEAWILGPVFTIYHILFMDLLLKPTLCLCFKDTDFTVKQSICLAFTQSGAPEQQHIKCF